mmetsp:Transcript_75093/g.212394  ORF Transcript_75093/g.212394 Transcript_75093/m.212394 type:complete len:483 (-) Transcript_75093:144-1592(-)
MAAAQERNEETTEREALEVYIRRHKVEEVAQDIVQWLLQAKPENPRKWLLERLEQDLSDESEDLSDADLHKLFVVTRKITAEIIPQDTIHMVISETLKLLNCDTVSLFILDRKSGMLRLYASNLETPIQVSPGQGIAGSVFNTKETVNIPNCYEDPRFDKSFDKSSGYITKSLLAVPIVDFDATSAGVIQAINKLPEGDNREDNGIPSGKRAVPFARNDVKILLHLAQHVGIAMRNAEVYREAISSSERATGLLNTIQSLSQDLGTQSMLLTITMHANKIVSAQRSTVFLVDEPNTQLWSVSTDTGQEIRIPKKAGIAGLCCTKGELINIPDAYADSRFNQEVDKKTGFRTHSILAIPMLWDGAENASQFQPSGSMASSHQVIGVIQMINKVSFDGQLECFDDADVEVMELFAKFVAPKLATSSMLARRAAGESQEKKEVELGLSKKAEDNLFTERVSLKERRSSLGIMSAFGEEDESEDPP